MASCFLMAVFACYIETQVHWGMSTVTPQGRNRTNAGDVHCASTGSIWPAKFRGRGPVLRARMQPASRWHGLSPGEAPSPCYRHTSIPTQQYYWMDHTQSAIHSTGRLSRHRFWAFRDLVGRSATDCIHAVRPA